MSRVRIASAVATAVLAVAALAGCNHTHPHPGPTPAPTATDSLVPTMAPGGYCATSSLGKSFVKSGITYVCKAPKPYRWLPTGTSPSPAASPSSATPPISAEQRNAVRAAADYLDGQSFSRKGLISQLGFEGYSTKASTAAVDSLHVDWNAQAVLTAKNYLADQAFSRKGLTEQLEYEGFSASQATHGVKGAGL